MHHINLNIFQIVIFILFIYTFTYFWLPKQKCNDTDEYIKLLEKYNKVVDDKMRLKERLINNRSSYKQPKMSLNNAISAHSSSIIPRNINDNDNLLVEQILH